MHRTEISIWTVSNETVRPLRCDPRDDKISSKAVKNCRGYGTITTITLFASLPALNINTAELRSAAARVHQ